MLKTRFAPSPTGSIHIGNARTALFNALYALHEAGVFVLRIEDTDQARSQACHVDSVMADLRALGVEWQEGAGCSADDTLYYQSARADIYASYYDQLIERDLAYPCFCSEQQLAITRRAQRSAGQPPRYPGTCAGLSAAEVAEKSRQGDAVLRFRLPRDTEITFDDIVKGPQRFASNDLGDFIIRRANGTPSFMFSNAIDDALMEITHVLRGDDHLTNTPRQVMILRTLGLREPIYGHLSSILGEDGSPLSKRHGSWSIRDMLAEGYLPQALLNYLARLGHHYVTNENQLQTLAQLAQGFDPQALGNAPTRFDQQQLLYWQKTALLALDDAAVWAWLAPWLDTLVPAESQSLFVETVRENIHTPSEAQAWASRLFTDEIHYEPAAKQAIADAGPTFFNAAIGAFSEHGLDTKAWLAAIKKTTGCKGRALFLPIRAALTGQLSGPQLPAIARCLGDKRMALRLSQASTGKELPC